MEAFVRAEAPDVVFHLATASQPTGRADEGWLVNYTWSSELAWICRQLGIGFLFTSSVLVFSNQAQGPFTLESIPDAEEGYGYEKMRAETRVLEQYPEAWVLRLGWQIAEAGPGNHMVEHCVQQMKENGVVRASRRWLPACSFLDDTVDAVVRCVRDAWAPGMYMLDSNSTSALTFEAIVRRLNEQRGRPWRVEANEDFVYDQRMIDPRSGMASLSRRLESS